MLTILRYLWEETNNYHDIVPMTKTIMERVPGIDPLKAVLIANSGTAKAIGWGHSLVKGMTRELKGIWHYRRYKGTTVYGLTNTAAYGAVPEEFMQIRKDKESRLDVTPMLKHYGLV